VSARPARFEALLDAYERLEWTEDERFALGGLLFSTLDDRLYGEAPSDEVLTRFEALMVRDAPILASRIAYWALSDERDPDNTFRVTPVARRIRAAAEAAHG
jgi:hypothetical protein